MTDLSAISIKPVLTLAEAAAYAGVSEITVKRLCKDRKIAYSKITNKLVYIERAELERFLMSGRVASDHELEAQADAYFITMKKKVG